MTKASPTTITAQRLAALTAAADGTAREIEALEAKLRAIALRKRAIAERAVEENAAADAAAALARAAAQMAAREELPSREEQAFIDAEIGKSEEQQCYRKENRRGPSATGKESGTLKRSAHKPRREEKGD